MAPEACSNVVMALFAGGDTRHVVCLHLPGASEASGAVGGPRRGALFRQDFQPAPLPLCRLLYSKTLLTSTLGFRLTPSFSTFFFPNIVLVNEQKPC